MKEPVLKMFNLKKVIQIEIDASDLIIEACLSQKHKGKWHSVAYLLRKLLSVKQNYDIHNKELLAIIASLKS